MFGVDGDLNIVANHVSPLAVTRHGARVRIDERDLRAGTSLQSCTHFLQIFDPLAQALDLVLEPRRPFLGDLAAYHR